jgi:hypothetical protein
MRKYKIVAERCISFIGEGNLGEEITEAEYNAILEIIHAKPARTDTTDYRLREDLTWEAYEVELPEPDPEEELTAEEIAEAIEEALA